MRKTYITGKESLIEIGKAKDKLLKTLSGKNLDDTRFKEIKDVYVKLVRAEKHIGLRMRFNDEKRKDYERGYFLALVQSLLK